MNTTCLSNANYKRLLKGKVQDILWAMGINASVTNSATICFFTDKPWHKNSLYYWKGSHEIDQPYMTSLGVVGAEKFIAENS